MASLLEHAAKELLAEAGIVIPAGRVAATASEAARIVSESGPSVIKAQVATGGRGKAGGIRFVRTGDEALDAARAILDMHLGGKPTESVLVEPQVQVRQEMYAAIMNDTAARSPIMLFSATGGMEIEEIVRADPDSLVRHVIDINVDLKVGQCREALGMLAGDVPVDAVVDTLMRLYGIYRQYDAELVEINPLAITTGGSLVALDCKMTVDDSALTRQERVADLADQEPMTDTERRAASAGLKFIELDGNVGVLANGAGLTMTTMDAIVHFGGRPANFLEIGGDAYGLGSQAATLLADMPGLKSIVVNFCGAFARTDVMASGIIDAWSDCMPAVPVHFSIHGTGEMEAVAMIRERLGIEPHERMDDAIRAAVVDAS